MPGVSDLVLDALLQTRFDTECTVHTYIESGQTAKERVISREEHWKRQKCVGGGSYGRVWLEQCVRGQREAEVRAVKEVVKSPDGSRTIDYNRELEAITRFSNRKEYERCFVKSYGWYENDDAVFIAMEYLKLGDLQRYLATKPPLAETDAQQIIFQVLEGLHFMHINNYSHRDLKPGNILIVSQAPDHWWVKLGDFGISKRAADTIAVSSAVKGTLMYMAPELLGFIESSDESDYDRSQAADMWALGEIAFQMLTKQQTFKNFSVLSVYIVTPDSFPTTVLRAHSVSKEGIHFIRSVMQPKPEDRQKAAGGLLDAWMEPCSTHATGKFSSLVEGRVPLTLMPGSPSQEESLFIPSGRWSTVSNAVPQLPSPTAMSVTSVEDRHIPGSTMVFPATNSSTLTSMTQETTTGINTVKQGRFFILKSSNEVNIETSAAHGIWCSARANNTRLSNAYNRTSGPIFLIFSVNESRKFCGVAQMKSPWNSSVTSEHWEDGTWHGGFLVEWLSFISIEFDEVKHLTDKEENGMSITRARFVTEICTSTGVELMRRFGVSGMVPQQSPEPSDVSGVSNLGVGGLGLATATTTNASNGFKTFSDPAYGARRNSPDRMDTSTSTPIRKRTLKMFIEDSEDDEL